ncbi:hypothetical protein [Terribacillus saccharophilus]|uniref:hypothetical protein n=1 Tax=Terribacillus saccharophilus TaxID=361277 RepID=UPI002989C537|nr:hypothetical protein [Terribacillus saccharophilus]MCM3227558.1 hypothetical protein [Terribacillus saccharophilus]
MSKKQFFWNIFSFVAILALVVYVLQVRSDIEKIKGESAEWEGIAKSEQEVPDLNKRAESFLDDLTHGESKKYLTGLALDNYNAALKEEEEEHGEEFHNHNHIDTSEQDLEIIQTSTEKTDLEEAKSTILYKLEYTSPFDVEDAGLVDKRILTLSINIKWVKDDDEYKVERYEVTLLEDNLDQYLASLNGKDSENE